jgi:imidazolonepropionase-like amidohydrolase
MSYQRRPKPFSIHTSVLFDPRKKRFIENVSIEVDPASGSIADMYQRTEDLDTVPDGDIDLRGLVTMPGFVDAHTHIFLHSYEYALK